jgi:hypothetical protein
MINQVTNLRMTPPGMPAASLRISADKSALLSSVTSAAPISKPPTRVATEKLSFR